MIFIFKGQLPCFWGGKAVFDGFFVANLVRKYAIMCQNEAKLLQSCALFIRNEALFSLGHGRVGAGLAGIGGGGFGDLGMQVQQVGAGFSDFDWVAGFFADKGQAGNGGGGAAGQFETGLEVVLVEVHAEFVEENGLGEPAFEGAVSDVEVSECVGDLFADFEDVVQEPALFSG